MKRKDTRSWHQGCHTAHTILATFLVFAHRRVNSNKKKKCSWYCSSAWHQNIIVIKINIHFSRIFYFAAPWNLTQKRCCQNKMLHLLSGAVGGRHIIACMAEAWRAEEEVGFLGRTWRAPSPLARGLRERCKLLQWDPGRSPGRNWFTTVFTTKRDTVGSTPRANLVTNSRSVLCV